MRIHFPVLVGMPSSLASAVQVSHMAQAFAELGHAVTVVAPTPDPAMAGDQDVRILLGFAPRFRTVRLARRVHRGQSYVNAARFLRMVRHDRPDLIFSRDLRACLLPAVLGVPTVLEIHSVDSVATRQDRWALSRLVRARGFRGVVVVSSALAEDVERLLGIPAAAVHVAHDGVRLDTPGPTAVQSSRSPRPTGTLQVAYTGSLFQGRGIELLLEVTARAPWVILHIAGGPRALAEELVAQLHASGQDRVVVHGLITPVAARALQQDVDVVIAPFGRKVGTDSGVDTSRWMSPMKVFEYMASGRPIVISDLPVLREVLRPDVDALMVPPEDPDALLAALERLRDDPDLCVRLATSALDRVRAEFTWELRARRILERFGA